MNYTRTAPKVREIIKNPYLYIGNFTTKKPTSFRTLAFYNNIKCLITDSSVQAFQLRLIEASLQALLFVQPLI